MSGEIESAAGSAGEEGRGALAHWRIAFAAETKNLAGPKSREESRPLSLFFFPFCFSLLSILSTTACIILRIYLDIPVQ